MKDVEVLCWRQRGPVGREGVNGVLDRHPAGGFEYPTDLDRSVVVAHERDWFGRRKIVLGTRSEERNNMLVEEGVIGSLRG